MDEMTTTKELFLNFELPSYTEIPDVGLYLEQTVKFVSEYLKPIHSVSLTGSMVSNYVKKGLVKNPVKKQYYRDQIAVIMFIAIAKTVISLEEIQTLLNIQEETDSIKASYEYLRAEFKDILNAVFSHKALKETEYSDEAQIRALFHNVIVTVAYKVYVEHTFEEIMNKEK